MRIIVITSLLVAQCSVPDVYHGIFCDETIDKTSIVAHQVAYGVELEENIIPVTNRIPFNRNGVGLPISKIDRPSLIFVGGKGELYIKQCKRLLCDPSEFFIGWDSCRKKDNCLIAGVAKSRTFYPMYLKDKDGKHICGRLG